MHRYHFGFFFSETGKGGYVRCSQSFLFSMVNPQGMAPSKMPLVQNQQHAINCQWKNGPTFGGGHDLHISHNANTSGASYSYLGHTYQLPTGQLSTFYTGAQNFDVTDYEVFGICWSVSRHSRSRITCFVDKRPRSNIPVLNPTCYFKTIFQNL